MIARSARVGRRERGLITATFRNVEQYFLLLCTNLLYISNHTIPHDKLITEKLIN